MRFLASVFAFLLATTSAAFTLEAGDLARALERAAAKLPGCEVRVRHLETFFPEEGGWTSAVFYSWSECAEGNAWGSFVEFYDFDGSELAADIHLAGADFTEFDNEGGGLGFDLITWGDGDPGCCPSHGQRVKAERSGGTISLAIGELAPRPGQP